MGDKAFNNVKEFLFSIVIAVYNTEQYLGEAIQSVLNQSIGFEENVQLILIDDGSTDSSYSICKKYADQYPNNILVIKQDNMGVSGARNTGMKYIKGKYINFMDSDDKLSKDALFEVNKLFNEREVGIDVVSIKKIFFDALEGEHKLNHKFYEDRVIDIEEDYQDIQLGVQASFFKQESIKTHRFDKKLKVAEDMKFISEVIMNTGRYGVCTKPIYYYRKRQDDSSLIQSSKSEDYWLFDTPVYAYEYLFDKSKELHGKVIPYIQYIVMHDLQYRFRYDEISYLTKHKQKRYMQKIKNLLKDIEDKIIWEQRSFSKEHKLYAISIKYGEPLKQIKKESIIKDGWLYIKGHKVQKVKRSKLVISEVEIIKGNLLISTYLNTLIPYDKFELYMLKDNTQELVAMNILPEHDRYSLKELIHQKVGFILKVNVKDIKQISFEIRLKDGNKYRIPFSISNKTFRSSRYLIEFNSPKISIVNISPLKSVKTLLRRIYNKIQK